MTDWINQQLIRMTFSVTLLFIFGCVVFSTSTEQTSMDGSKNKYTNLEVANITVPICSDYHKCNVTKHTNTNFRKGCHCDIACQYFNDCCHDYSEPDVYFEDRLNELHATLKNRGISKSDWQCHRKGYWSVSRCDKDVGVISDKCHHPTCNDTLSFVQVTDPDGITYRNVYCATCHGVKVSSLKAWKVEADCSPVIKQRLQDANTSSLDINLVCSECKMTSHIPQDFIENLISTRSCFPDAVSTCVNMDQNSEEQRACDAYTAFVNVRGTTYRNPHCFLCNTNETTLNNHTLTCKGEGIPRIVHKSQISAPNLKKLPTEKKGKNLLGPSTRGGMYRPSVTGVPLSIILDFGSGESSSVRVFYQKEVIIETKMSCPSGHVYVELPGGGECLSLQCPDGMTLINGDCVLLPASTRSNSTVDKETKWCGNYSDISVTLTVTLVLPESICNNRTLINFYSDCLFDAVQIEQIASSCMETERHKTEISIEMNSTEDMFNQIGHTMDRIYHRGISTNRLPCGLDSITVTQTCLDKNSSLSCPSDWQSPENISFKVLNDTQHIYQNTSGTMHTMENLISRVRYTVNATQFKKETEIKQCRYSQTLKCPYLTLSASLFKTFNDSNTILFVPQGNMLGPDEYLVVSDSIIQVCNFFEHWTLQNETTYETFFTYSDIQTILSLVGSAISMVAMTITFVTLMIFPSLRNTTSRLIMNLIVALFIGQLLLILGGFATQNKSLCFAAAIVSHYVWLSVFTSMNALAFDLNRTFGQSKNLQSINNRKRDAIMNIGYSWGTPLLVIIPCLIIHYCQLYSECESRLQVHYGSDGACWIGDGIANLVTFATPAAGFLLVNFLLFVQTVRGIWLTKRSTSRVYNDGSVVKKVVKELIIYLKLSTLMGFSWTTGFVASFTGLTSLWYIFIILNSLQGLFIFMSFTFNQRVGELWKKRLLPMEHDDASSKFKEGRIRGNVTSNIPCNNTNVTISSYNSIRSPFDERTNVVHIPHGSKQSG